VSTHGVYGNWACTKHVKGIKRYLAACPESERQGVYNFKIYKVQKNKIKKIYLPCAFRYKWKALILGKI
jgi:hypothetical protein